MSTADAEQVLITVTAGDVQPPVGLERAIPGELRRRRASAIGLYLTMIGCGVVLEGLMVLGFLGIGGQLHVIRKVTLALAGLFGAVVLIAAVAGLARALHQGALFLRGVVVPTTVSYRSDASEVSQLVFELGPKRSWPPQIGKPQVEFEWQGKAQSHAAQLRAGDTVAVFAFDDRLSAAVLVDPAKPRWPLLLSNELLGRD